MGMPPTVTLSFRVAEEDAKRLDQLAQATDRPRSWHLEKALSAYIAEQAWQVAQIHRGIADLDAGRSVPHDKVSAWLRTWGTKAEGQPPDED